MLKRFNQRHEDYRCCRERTEFRCVHVLLATAKPCQIRSMTGLNGKHRQGDECGCGQYKFRKVAPRTQSVLEICNPNTHTFLCVCVTHIHVHLPTQTDKQTDRQTDWHAHARLCAIPAATVALRPAGWPVESRNNILTTSVKKFLYQPGVPGFCYITSSTYSLTPTHFAACSG